MIVDQLNELVMGQPEAPARSRQNGKSHSAALPSSLPQSSSSILDAAESDSDEDDDGRVRNDGTLLASDPPKPL